MTDLLRLSEAQIRQQSGEESFARGMDYYRRGAVGELLLRDGVLRAAVEGSQYEPYAVTVSFDAAGVATATCTCPYDWGGWCKHCVAVMLAVLYDDGAVARRPGLAALIAGLDREALAGLLIRLAQADPTLADRADLLLAAPAPRAAVAPPAARAAPPPRRTSVDVEAFRRQVRGVFRGYNQGDYYAASGIVPAMGELSAQVSAFIAGGEAEEALPLLAAITDEYSQSWIEYDDSDGELGAFFDDLGRLWAEAILSADLADAERAVWADQLDVWAAQAGEYGVEGLDLALRAAAEGWSSPQVDRAMRGELESWDLSADHYGQELTPIRLRVLEQKELYAEAINLAAATGHHRAQALLLLRLGRVADAVSLAAGRFARADDALALATALREAGQIAEAMGVAEAGLDLAEPRAALGAWLADVAAAAGRPELALPATAVAFRSAPSLPLYLRLQELAGQGWPARREDLLAFLRDSIGRWDVRHAAVDIFLHEALIDDAIAVVSQSAGWGDLARVADAAIPSRPDWVVQASQDQAERIMDAGKAQHYAAAVEWLRRAQAAYRASGRPDLWEAYVADLRAKHSRKHKLIGLMAPLGRPLP